MSVLGELGERIGRLVDFLQEFSGKKIRIITERHIMGDSASQVEIGVREVLIEGTITRVVTDPPGMILKPAIKQYTHQYRTTRESRSHKDRVSVYKMEYEQLFVSLNSIIEIEWIEDA